MAVRHETRQPRSIDITSVEVDAVEPRLRNRIQGGSVWGGFVVALATWMLLELILFSVELTGINAGGGSVNESEWWWSGAAVVIAFFLGGLVAGASSTSRRSDTGMIQGITVWALGVVAVLILAALGAGVGFGAFGDTLGQAETARNANRGGADEAVSEQAVNTAQDAAGAAALFLALTLAGAAAGGSAGAKMWPRTDRVDEGRATT